MKLYDGAILFLLIAAIFGYVTYQVDKTAVDGEIQVKAVKEEIKEDYREAEAFFKAGKHEYKLND